jgi:hypothetical protein
MPVLTACRTFLRATLRLRPSRSAVDPDIARAAAELAELNRLTERDFLAVGEKLMDFRAAALRISSDMAVLTGLIGGEESRGAAGELDRLLEGSRAMNARIAESSQSLAGIRSLALRVRQLFVGLPHTVLLFRTLCTLTRIETARLGELTAGFVNLAEEVRPLSESIQCSGQGVVAAATYLDFSVRADILSVSALQEKRQQEMQPLIAAVVDGMAEFAERQRSAHEASLRQAAQYEALCGAIDELVRSIQFHDITRQQVEHIREALAGGGHTRALLLLQASQLDSAARIFASAVGGIEDSLDNIAARLEGMAEESRSLMGISEQDHTSFFLHIENCFTVILRGLDACSGAQQQIRHTAAGLAREVERMRASLEEIRSLETRIHRTAVNATISAAHLGGQGDALGIIAGGMQALVAGSSDTTEAAAGLLDGIREAAATLSADATAGVSPECMQQAVLNLHSASELSFARVTQIAALGFGLAQDIHALRAAFSAGRIFSETVERVGATLRCAASKMAGGGSVAALEANYTMEVEREIHRAAVGDDPTVPEGKDMGDNVELF